jgi:hypothetical protein
LLLTGAAVSAAAVLLAIWINSPAEVTPASHSAPSTRSDAGPEADAHFVSPVKDGVWPSAVISEDMSKALEGRTEGQAEAASARASAQSSDEDAGAESPREIGEFIDPDAMPANTRASEPQSIGEFLDPDAVPAAHGAEERIAIGAFLDPDEPQITAGTNQPVSIGRPIDPDGAALPLPATQANRIEIGEYIEVESP